MSEMETKMPDALGHDEIAARLKARLNRDDFENSTARWMGVYRTAVQIHREREAAKNTRPTGALREVLDVLQDCHRHYSADAPEWQDSDTANCRISIGLLRKAAALNREA